MQKLLAVVLGVLAVVIVIELAVLFRQSDRQRQAKPVLYTASSPSPKPQENPLPLSSPDKDGVQVYVDQTDEISKDYIAWADGDFYYFRRKDSKKSVAPYLVRGTVKEAKDNEFEVEAQTADKTLYLVKIKLLPDVTVEKSGRNVSITEIKAGSTAQFLPLRQSKKEGEYYLVRKVTVFKENGKI